MDFGLLKSYERHLWCHSVRYCWMDRFLTKCFEKEGLHIRNCSSNLSINVTILYYRLVMFFQSSRTQDVFFFIKMTSNFFIVMEKFYNFFQDSQLSITVKHFSHKNDSLRKHKLNFNSNIILITRIFISKYGFIWRLNGMQCVGHCMYLVWLLLWNY